MTKSEAKKFLKETNKQIDHEMKKKKRDYEWYSVRHMLGYAN